MREYQIAVVVGSLRAESFNRKLADAVVKLAPTEFKFRQLEIGDLPLYNQDDDKDQAASVKRLKRELQSGDGVVFVTPEYNRSIPGVLKNALDHASRPYGQSRLGGQAGRRSGHIGRRDRHGRGAAAFAHGARLPRYADPGTARGVHRTSARVVGNSCRAGWTATLPGSDSTLLDALECGPACVAGC